MKAVLLALVVSLLVPASSVLAGKEPPKDPDKMAAETREFSNSLLKEAMSLEEKAASLAGKDAAAVSRFAKVTRSEAESLAKASDAWAKNQKRLAEKHMKDAAEFCSDRGKLAHDLKVILASPNKGEACEPKKGDACEPKKEQASKKGGPAEKKPASSNEVDQLHEQISRLGKPEE